jgi:hypothetical protein
MAAAATVAGCDADGRISAANFLAQLDRRECDFLVSCDIAPDRSSCGTASLPFSREGEQRDQIAAVGRGTVAYDDQAAQACLTAAYPADCRWPLLPPEPCTRIFRGQVPTGGDCLFSGECADGGTCMGDACVSACCATGTCVAGDPIHRIPLGGDCSRDSAGCIGGTACREGRCMDPRTASSSVLCVPVGLTLDAPIDCFRVAEDGEECDTRPLLARFACRRADQHCETSSGRCHSRKPAGASCAATTECLGYATCTGGSCVARPMPGSACDVETGCAVNAVCRGGVCVSSEPPAVCGPPGG